jgi:hypothetical protein
MVPVTVPPSAAAAASASAAAIIASPTTVSFELVQCTGFTDTVRLNRPTILSTEFKSTSKPHAVKLRAHALETYSSRGMQKVQDMLVNAQKQLMVKTECPIKYVHSSQLYTEL